MLWFVMISDPPILFQIQMSGHEKMTRKRHVNMRRNIRKMSIGVCSFAGTLFVGTLVVKANTTHSLLGQIVETTTLPGTISRLNIGAILAASLVALIVELALNLLGIAIGASTINPKYGEDSATPQELGAGAVGWIALSTLVSLFAGGWLAARFAGIPNNIDGLLHGVVTWALVTLVSVALLTTTAGRLLSGMTGLISHGLTLAGMTAGGVVRGAAGVAQTVAQSAENAAQRAGTTLQNTAQQAADRVEDAVASRPELDNFTRQRDQVLQDILAEGRQLLQSAGINPDSVRNNIQNAAQDATVAVKAAVQNPAEAEKIFTDTLTRVLNRTQAMANQVDRDAVVQTISERTHVSREQAEQTVRRWEDTLSRVRSQAEQTVQEVQRKGQEIKQEAQYKIAEARYEADRVARNVADATAKAISQLALTAFGAMLLGAIAAGLGGTIGAPVSTTSVSVTPIIAPAPTAISGTVTP